MGYAVEFSDVQAAAQRVAGTVKRTVVVSSEELNDIAGREVLLKCENLQHVGAFKFRGATNAVRMLDEDAEMGVCTHSSGNHAQALALAAKQRGVPAYIVMPNTAPKVKVVGVQSHDAEITFCEPTLEDREATAASVIERTGATLVHPYDNPNVIAGQGTVAMELFEQAGPMDAVIAPVGGGGLMSGTCITTRALFPKTRLFGVRAGRG